MKKEIIKKEVFVCPWCKVPIKSFSELKLKTEYFCGSCDKIFFIEKVPNFFFNA